MLKNVLEGGTLAMYVFAPENAGGMCLAEAFALTHGGWRVHQGEGFKAQSDTIVDTRREAIKLLESWFGKLEEAT